jgi:hypothetical protein
MVKVIPALADFVDIFYDKLISCNLSRKSQYIFIRSV